MSLNTYLNKINLIPLLSGDDEKVLGIAIASGCDSSKKLLVESNLRLVYTIAKKYKRKDLDIMDLIQEGNFGLIRASEKFDPSLGYKFSTYATWWIRVTIEQALIRHGSSIKHTMRGREKCNKLTKAKKAFIDNNKCEPTNQELANFLQITLEEFENFQSFYLPKIVSLNTNIIKDDGQSTELINTLVDYSCNLENNATKKNLKKLLIQILESLPPKEKIILKMRFGIPAGDAHTLKEIGDVYGITKAAVHAKLKVILKKLKKYKPLLKDYLYD